MSTRPGPPTNIEGIGGNSTLTISWTPATSGGPVSSFTAVGFAIPTNISNTVSSNISTITLAALNGTPYLPIVFANGPARSSIPPESITPATMPLPPTNLRVVYTNTTGDGEISWTPPTNDGGADISSYKIYSNSSGSAIIVSTTTTSTIVNGFTYGTPYSFTATAINSVGESVRSLASARITPLMLPTSPINVAANMISSGMRISWETPASTGGTPITGYTIQKYIDLNYVEPPIVISGGAISSIILSTLSNGTSYEFGVMARNRIGLSPQSDLTSSILYYATPIAPLGVIASQISTTSSALVSYENSLLNFYTSSFNIRTIPSTTLTTTSNLSTVVTGLTYGVSYRFSVSATNIRGTSLPTRTFADVTPMTVPDAPPSATVTSSANLANISWTSPTFSGGTSVYAYRITTFDSSGNSQPSFLVGANIRSLQLSTLILANTYSFGVSALNTIGFSLSTMTSSILITGPPGVPTNLSSISKNTAAIVNWTPPSGNGLTISSYTFTTSPPGGNTIYYDSYTGYAVIGGLTNGTLYTISVSASNSDGRGPTARTAVRPTSAVVIPPYIPNPGLVSGPRIYAQSGDYVSIFAGSNFHNFSYAIPPGSWSTLSSISTMLALTPGATTSTISGNISVVFPEEISNVSLKLIGENSSGSTITVTYVSSSAATLLSGANGQFPAIALSNWDYARSIEMSGRLIGTVSWVKQLSTFNSTGENVTLRNTGVIYNTPITADSAGCYLLYRVRGTILDQAKIGSSNDYDIAVARFNKNGSVDWVRQVPTFNTSGDDEPVAITSDSTGCYLLYSTKGTISGQQKSSEVDTAIARVSRTGNLEWVRQQSTFNSLSNSTGIFTKSTFPVGIVADSSGCYVLSETTGTITGQEANISGGPQVVISRFSNNGTLEWVKQRVSANANTSESARGIVADSSGCYVLYISTILRVARLNHAGAIEWTLGFGTNNVYSASIVATSTHCYITYQTDVASSGNSKTGTWDIVIARVNQDGSLSWQKQNSDFNTTSSQDWPRIAEDSTGCYLLFRTTGTIPGAIKAGNFDAVVARFAENGDLLWIKQSPEFNSATTPESETTIVDIVADEYGCSVLSIVNQAIFGDINGAGDGVTGLDIVVSRFTKQGVVEWASQSPAINTPGAEYGTGIVLGFNECYITYITDDTVSGGQRTGSEQNVVVARFT